MSPEVIANVGVVGLIAGTSSLAVAAVWMYLVRSRVIETYCDRVEAIRSELVVRIAAESDQALLLECQHLKVTCDILLRWAEELDFDILDKLWREVQKSAGVTAPVPPALSNYFADVVNRLVKVAVKRMVYGSLGGWLHVYRHSQRARHVREAVEVVRWVAQAGGLPSPL